MLDIPKQHAVLLVLTENKVFYLSKKALHVGATQTKLALVGKHIEMKMVNCQFCQFHQKLSWKHFTGSNIYKIIVAKKKKKKLTAEAISCSLM